MAPAPGAGGLSVPHEEGRAAFVDALDHFVDAVEPLDDNAFLAATWCWGWSVVDLVTHVRLGLEEVAAGLLAAGPSAAAPDHDAATYWLSQPSGGADEEVAGVLHLRRLASATRSPRTALVPLRVVADALLAGTGRLPDGVLAFQGCTLTTGDFLATWAVELAVHQLDLARDVEVPPPPRAALDLAHRTVRALTDAGLARPGFADRLPPGPVPDETKDH